MDALKRLLLLSGLFWLTGGVASAQDNKNEVTVDLSNELNVNTAGLEFSATFYEDGIVFISTNKAGLKKLQDAALDLPTMSILRSRRNTEGQLMAPEPFAKELTSKYHQGPVCFDRTAETVFYSTNVLVNGKPKFAKDGMQKMRLYSAVKSGETWGVPVALPFNDGEFNDGHPAISIDGDKLYFASDRPGGYGGYDLYVSYRVGDSWSQPVNLGETINSKGNEVFPFIHADNTVYFASDGQGGEGGLDLFYAIPEDNNWTKPVNLGAPFNTAGDDFGLIVDLNKINGYFNSNGKEGSGGDDVFSFHTENGNLDDYLLQNRRVPDRDLDLLVNVTEKVSSAPVGNAEVRILNLDNSNVIGRDEDGNLITVQKIDGQDIMRSLPPDQGIEGVTDKRGRFNTVVKPANYAIIVSREGFQTKQVQLLITKPGNEVNVVLEQVSGKVEWNATVFNYITNAPLAGAILVLTNEATGGKDTVIVDANGMVDYYLDTNTKYKVDLFHNNRLVGTTEIDTGGWSLPNQIMMQNISVAPLLPGSVIELPNIYYNFNDATLRPDARKDLDLVLALLKQHPAITIELSSHTDARGTTEYNQKLSQRRADGVVAYLSEKGIARERMTPVGYGESLPRNQCKDGVNCSEQDHARNRRTEIKIITGVQGASVMYLDGQPTGQQVLAMSPEELKKAEDEAKVNIPPPNVTTVAVNSGSMEYFVIAGSFLMESRAQNHLKTIRDAGYESAEIVQFPNSPFFSVCVQKSASRKDANALKRKLQSDSNIDAFVRAVAPNQ